MTTKIYLTKANLVPLILNFVTEVIPCLRFQLRNNLVDKLISFSGYGFQVLKLNFQIYISNIYKEKLIKKKK